MLGKLGDYRHQFTTRFGQSGPASSSPAPATERRQWIRFPSQAETVCEPTAGEDREQVPARILDVSAGGICLAMNRSFPLGDLLHVFPPASRQTRPRALLTCVLHAEEKPDGAWSLGCSFIRELSDEELGLFLVATR